MNKLAYRLACRMALSLMATLAACGGGSKDGGSSSSQSSASSTSSSAPTYSITATISGLTGTGLVLQNNGAGSVPVAAGASSAAIASGVASGITYAVTVQTQPAGQFCTVANGSGTVSGNVSNIAISCVNANTTFTVGGTISGYTGSGLALRLNGQAGAAFNVTPVSGAANFQFTAQLTPGTGYGVAIIAQPASPAQLCIINGGGGGTVGTSNVTNVTVACANSSPYTVGGTISGLTGTGLSLRMFYAGSVTSAPLSVAANAGNFAFPDIVPANGFFDVGILAQPAGQTCTISGGRGISNVNVANIGIACRNSSGDALSGVYSVLDTATGRQYLGFNGGTYTLALRNNDTRCNTTTDTRNGNGVEYGVFAWNGTTGAFSLPITPVVDTTGSCGFANSGNFAASFTGPLTKTGNSLTIPTDTGTVTAVAVVGANPSTELVGAFVPEATNGGLLVFHADGTFMNAETQGRGATFLNTQERGCYLVAGSDLTLTIGSSCTPDGLPSYDFNGPYGFGTFGGGQTSVGPIPFTIESASVITIGGYRYRRLLPN